MSSTIVGADRVTANRNNTDLERTEEDETWKRGRCSWFEKRLHFDRYRRDKKNEERNGNRDGYVRINSKRLHSSYDVPLEECYPILKRLRHILAPSDLKTNSKRRQNLDLLYEWTSCADFTVLTVPKTPTVLWLDVDCVKCKTPPLLTENRATTSSHRHFKSSIVIDTVLRVVDEYRSREGISVRVEPDSLYVTRGTTCGMHLFFPQIVVHDECCLLDIWSEINKRLRTVDVTSAAAVDTGCSAMPLPLARHHSGLTRIVYNGCDIVRRTHIARPLIQDLASVTTFYNSIADCFDNTSGENSSSVSSVVIGSTTTTCTGGHLQNSTEQNHVVKAPAPSALEQDIFSPLTNDTVRVLEDAVCVSVDREIIPAVPVLKDFTLCDGATTNDLPSPDTRHNVTGTDKEADDGRSAVSISSSVHSGSSTTSKRELVQTDLRELCAKIVNERKRKRSSSSQSETSSFRQRKRFHTTDEHPTVLVVDDEDEHYYNNNNDEGSESKKNIIIEDCDDDVKTNSSFICAGYTSAHHRKAPITNFGSASSSVKSGPSSSSSNVTATTATVNDGLPPITDNQTAFGESIPADARVPVMYFTAAARRKGGAELQRIARAKEVFKENMTVKLDDQENQTHETDIQFLLSSFNTELDVYTGLLRDSVQLEGGAEFDGLRTKGGCSLYSRRETCPPAMFPEHIPYVLHTGDYVTEREWVDVLIRYFDEYLDNAPALLVMSYVLHKDTNVNSKLDETTRLRIVRHVDSCLSRYKYDSIAIQRAEAARGGAKYVSGGPKHPYEDKCVVVCGLMTVCSVAFEMKTPLFTDMTKVARMLLVKSQQTLDSLNTSTMSTAGSRPSSSYPTGDSEEYDDVYRLGEEENALFDESVSQRAAMSETSDDTSWSHHHDDADQQPTTNASSRRETSHLGDNHAVLASLLRWNYTALADTSLWCLFFYYYHVNKDALERIVDETMHGGLMVTALIQAYCENATRNAPVDVRSVCNQVFVINCALRDGDDRLKCLDNDEDCSLMPPPPTTGVGSKVNGNSPAAASDGASVKGGQASKQVQRSVQETVPLVRNNGRGGGTQKRPSNKKKQDNNERYFFKTNFNEVLKLMVRHYLRPMMYDETTVVYTEAGYDVGQNEFSSSFAGADKDLKRHVVDLFNRSTYKYSMPHGDLLMYNTDVIGTVHKRSTCINNLVLNVFENMYGGCMSYLTRRYNNHLKLFNRFNGDAYRLVVECRHAMNGLVRSIDMSYLNLILRQPIVPPVLEADIASRNMFMRDDELRKGAFVCLNAMDYVRAINMFTRHTRFSQENCQVVESFLDKLATATAPADGDDEEARGLFRTVYLFYMLYIFEVLYKIRHAYRRDGSYNVCVERLSWELDVRVLLKLFFGTREFKTPRGLAPEFSGVLGSTNGKRQDAARPTSDGSGYVKEEFDDESVEDEEDNFNRTTANRCINTRPLVSTCLPDKMTRMMELFGKKGLTVMKSYAPLVDSDETARDRDAGLALNTNLQASVVTTTGGDDLPATEDADHVFLNMTQTQLEEALYSPTKWYENCHTRAMAVRTDNADRAKAERGMDGMDTFMDATSMDTFLRTQLRVHIDNNRLAQIERSARHDTDGKRDFKFCTHMPLRVKMMALVLATHSVKRLTTGVAEDFCRKEYRLERAGVAAMTTVGRDDDESTDKRPDEEWADNWNRLLSKRRRLLAYCRSLAATYFPESYFTGLQPDNTYHALYNYMVAQTKYVTMNALQHKPWAKEVCTALNYLLVTNGYDPELVELCLRLFLGFEWPGQWAKRIFVWKSNSNAGKSFFFEHVIQKAFDQSTCINDPKGGKDNAPEKSEYYRNFVLMVNEFSSASACELKKLCSTSSFKFRMNFGNHMIQAFTVGKMVFNCNTLPATTDHATIQRIALVPLPFWFQRRQTIVESMLNWTRGHTLHNEYEKYFKRNVSQILNTTERRFFLEHQETKNEDDLFNKPNEISLQLFSELADQNEAVKASMFLVQNKTSQVYMASYPPLNTIVAGIVTLTRYFCRFRFFNNIKEPVDYSVLPKACNVAAREWQRISQPYFEWKDLYRVQKDPSVFTKLSVINASLSHFVKNQAKTTTFFDLRQFFECDFAEQKISWHNAKEDEYNVRLDPLIT